MQQTVGLLPAYGAGERGTRMLILCVQVWSVAIKRKGLTRIARDLNRPKVKKKMLSNVEFIFQAAPSLVSMILESHFIYTTKLDFGAPYQDP